MQGDIGSIEIQHLSLSYLGHLHEGMRGPRHTTCLGLTWAMACLIVTFSLKREIPGEAYQGMYTCGGFSV